jgi:methylenetetrahydrofolate--tRNA-(uracil-5-)-methyltransferase
MHRNTFLNSPALLDSAFMLRGSENIFFAGQMTGVEGYTESAASGIIAGTNLARIMRGQACLQLPPTSMTGALMRHISTQNENFQPMGANMGILPELETQIKNKQERYEAIALRGINDLKSTISGI